MSLDKVVCRGSGCEKETDSVRPIENHWWSRYDFYGIFTGLFCNDCYENNYPYRRDDYFDESYAGERLE